MSNASNVRIIATECLRFPGEGLSTQGQAEPKPNPKGVGDGQQVKIPAPLSLRYQRRGDLEGSPPHADGIACPSTKVGGIGKSVPPLRRGVMASPL